MTASARGTAPLDRASFVYRPRHVHPERLRDASLELLDRICRRSRARSRCSPRRARDAALETPDPSHDTAHLLRVALWTLSPRRRAPAVNAREADRRRAAARRRIAPATRRTARAPASLLRTSRASGSPRRVFEARASRASPPPCAITRFARRGARGRASAARCRTPTGSRRSARSAGCAASRLACACARSGSIADDPGPPCARSTTGATRTACSPSCSGLPATMRARRWPRGNAAPRRSCARSPTSWARNSAAPPTR